MKNNKVVVYASLSIMASILFLLSVSPLSKSEAQNAIRNPEVVSIYNSIYQVGYRNETKGIRIAELIQQEAKKYKIDPKILVALIMVESSFRQDVVSETGDISLAQINVKTWKKEFKRLNRISIDVNKMHKDQAYAIGRMAEILSILAARHKNKKDWYAYYHSATPEHKSAYFKRVSNQLHKMEPLAQKPLVLVASY